MKGYLLGHPVRPMLATLVAAPFDRAGWRFEIKWDGYRAIAEVRAGQVKLYSRTGQPFESKFPSIAAALADFDEDVVLDGEIVVLDESGKSQFQLLQNYQKTGTGNLLYWIFDILYRNGEDLREMPLRGRQEALPRPLQRTRNLRISENVPTKGIAFFQAASAQGLEGIMAKDESSPYRESARGQAWLKIKTRQRQEAVIGGFTEPRGSRQSLGALVLGVYRAGDFVYIGHTGSGFSDRTLNDVRTQLQPLVQKACPFARKPRANAPVHWVKPVLVCEVAFQEWTGDGSMRQPIFLGLREDKPARSVRRETPKR